MKNLFFTTAALVALASTAHADSVVFKPYVGVDLQRTIVDYNNDYDIGGGLALNGNTILEDGLNGFNVHVGNRFHKNFGAELGYFRTFSESKSTSAGESVGPGTVAGSDFSTKVKLQGITLDALGYLPLGASEKFEVIGTAGISWIDGEIESTVPGVGTASTDENEFGFRIGGGAQYSFTENVSIRGLARYQTADFSDVAEDAITLSVGLNYSF